MACQQNKQQADPAAAALPPTSERIEEAARQALDDVLPVQPVGHERDGPDGAWRCIEQPGRGEGRAHNSKPRFGAEQGHRWYEAGAGVGS